ncbi:MAG: hypothetical protein ACFB13_12110 [Kiloniellaceae bacterium]
MVTIDDSLNETGAHRRQGWQPPRALALPVVLPLLLAGALAIGVTVTAAVSGDWLGGAAAASGEVPLASGTADPVQGMGPACARIQQIVQTACSLKQLDHDASGIHACIAYETKYTMWSAYGCR